ncbi:MAG: right-handed parallel beta-helix repeat-containing protein, partial [Myxococcota bacterium]
MNTRDVYRQLGQAFWRIVLVLLAGCGEDRRFVLDLTGSSPQALKGSERVNSAGFGGDLEVYPGETVVLDRALDGKDLGDVVVHRGGTLQCLRGQQVAVRVHLESLRVMGRFLCGTSEERPIEGSYTFVLKSDANAGRVLVMGGGEIRVFGDSQRAARGTLYSPVNRSDEITLNGRIDWVPGDRIAIAPTGFDFEEAEANSIAEVRFLNGPLRTRLTLEKPVTHGHFGAPDGYVEYLTSDGRSVRLHAPADVVNLTRSVRFEADDSSSEDRPDFMVMEGGRAWLDGVEVSGFGRSGVMGRYPVHWHLGGDVTGQFIKNSSIHGSSNRCIVIHRTSNLEVRNNVCFDVRGHAFFLEEGTERGNSIVNNIAVLTRLPREGTHLLESERRESNQPRRWAAPAAFWISHPDNDVRYNTAAGTEGTGFWMAFEERELCSECLQPNPSLAPTDRFRFNVSRTARIGFTWDGAPGGQSADNPRNQAGVESFLGDRRLVSTHYSPPRTPVFRNLEASKSLETAIYSRMDSAVFRRILTSDSGWHHFHAFNSRVEDSVLVGWGPAESGQTELDRLAQAVRGRGHYGFVQYDGPFELERVHFQRFSSNQV